MSFGGTDLQIDYEMVQEMIMSFQNAIQSLSEVSSEVRTIIGIASGGGMVGPTGDRFTGVLTDKLLPNLNISQDRLQEMIDELDATIRRLRDGDSTASSRFVD